MKQKIYKRSTIHYLQLLWIPYAVVKKQNTLIWLKKGSKVHAREQLYVWRRRAATEK